MKKLSILDLRPTQFVLGMREVDFKVAAIRHFPRKKLQRYCRDHAIPVILGPRGEPFMIDHHHFARACWETDMNEFEIKILKDCSKKSVKEFWNFMAQKNWVYLHDQFGLGPHAASALPIDIRFLADDPFRSLAWEAINKGWIKKSRVPFFEFQWAALFRRNMDMPLHSKSDFKQALLQIKELVKSSAAKRIPGFVR
jgi:hypothetical protein